MNVFIFPNSSNPFTAELERHQEMATQKWGFDFRADRPLNGNGSFIWERVSSQESNFAPQMYTLTRAAHVRNDVNGEPTDMDTLLMERADRENLVNSSMDSNNSDNDEYDSQNESLALGPSTSVAAFAAASAASASSSTSSSCNYATQQRKRQLKITGELRVYMYESRLIGGQCALRRSLSQRCASLHMTHVAEACLRFSGKLWLPMSRNTHREKLALFELSKLCHSSPEGKELPPLIEHNRKSTFPISNFPFHTPFPLSSTSAHFLAYNPYKLLRISPLVLSQCAPFAWALLALKTKPKLQAAAL